MKIAAGEDGNPRQLTKAILGDIGSMSLSPPLAGGAQTDEVGHGRPGGHDPAPGGWQVEQLLEPTQADEFQFGRQGRSDPGVGHLVQGCCQPVGAQRGRGHAANDEVKAARSAAVNSSIQAVIEKPA